VGGALLLRDLLVREAYPGVGEMVQYSYQSWSSGFI
jgi:hypothetical protein